MSETQCIDRALLLSALKQWLDSCAANKAHWDAADPQSTASLIADSQCNMLRTVIGMVQTAPAVHAGDAGEGDE